MEMNGNTGIVIDDDNNEYEDEFVNSRSGELNMFDPDPDPDPPVLHFPIPISTPKSIKTLLDKIPFIPHYKKFETFKLFSHLLAQFPVKTKQKQIAQPLDFLQHISMMRHPLYNWPILVPLLVTSMVISQLSNQWISSTILWTYY